MRTDSSFMATIKLGTEAIEGSIVDLYLNSLCMVPQTDVKILKGEHITVSIRADIFGKHYSISQLKGKVVRGDRKRVEVEFQDTTNAHRERLAAIIDYMSATHNDRNFLQFQLSLLSLGSFLDTDMTEQQRYVR